MWQKNKPGSYSDLECVRVIQLLLAPGMAMEELERVCCIRGYHVYKEVWEAAVGESQRFTYHPLDFSIRLYREKPFPYIASLKSRRC